MGNSRRKTVGTAIRAGNFLVAPKRISIIRGLMLSPDPRWPRQLAKGLLNGTSFTAALVGTACLIGQLLPFPEVPAIAQKYQYFAENRERIDTLFTGSSRVFHQIDPQQFDAEAAALGVPTRSANLASDSVWPPESFYFLRRLLALRPPHLRWVFIELMEINVRVETPNSQTLRTAYWHDWRHTVLAWREILASPRSPGEKWRSAAEHAAIFLRWNAGLGRGAELLREWRLPSKSTRPPPWVARRGFSPEPEKEFPAAELPVFREGVAELRRELRWNRVSAHYFEALSGLVAEVRRAGAEPIFLLTPSLSWRENFTGLPAGVPVFAYTDPRECPTLYELDRHYDAWHLNERGAAEFTSLLAHRFAQHLRQP